ncbi:wee1-like protein kinase [Telopea speciosissima]|uniref:wee1-like protein kinase n=1 Tax=Telopea speciosissima TaxID=54955 RepID=UPI001CC38B0A|nr:wee1-like protein kinase [Telopea speciosissima]
MKRKTLKRSRKDRDRMEGATLAMHLPMPLLPHNQNTSSSSNLSRFHLRTVTESEQLEEVKEQQQQHSSFPPDENVDSDLNIDETEKDFILSQDFFCTPDYITPDGQQISNILDVNKENIPCPKSPEKLKTVKSKKQRMEGFYVNQINSDLPCHPQVTDIASDAICSDELKTEKPFTAPPEKKDNYVPQSAVALRCRVMPPPCIRNPYLMGACETDLDPLGSRRSKSTGFFPVAFGKDGLSRYRTDFHEIEQIGYGNFSRVFKVLKRIDGCMYAVKHSIRQLHQDTERRQALMEVQALAALGSHENIVGYYNSWFENEQLYIQMELCDRSLSICESYSLFTEGDVLVAMHQIAKALQFIHERGIAHLDVKPDNIYVKNGVYKLGDFGCATLIDGSLPIEEGDARYMPTEILNDKYEHLDKVDIFSLGAAFYELVKGSPLPGSGPQFLNLREGKFPLLPGHSLQFQNLLKVMVDPDPVRRPSAKELVENPIFDKALCMARGN